MVEMMCMIKQLVIGGGHNSSGHSQEGRIPQAKNETQPPPEPNQGQTVPSFIPQRNNQEVDPSKDKTSESRYG